MGLAGSRGAIGLLAVLALGAMATVARGQTADPPPGPLAEPSKDPKDLSGIWQEKGYKIRYPLVGGGEAPYLPWAAAEAKRRGDAQKAGAPITDSVAQCLPHGIPRAMDAPYPIKIVQTKKEVVILLEVQHLFRLVYLNEDHPKNLEPTYLGHSVGHWEGDTLVVDTTGMNTLTLINEAGDPHSDKLRVIERFSKSADGKVLTDLVTIDDPGAYSKPWSVEHKYNWHSEFRLMEYVCEENNRDVTDADGVVHAR